MIGPEPSGAEPSGAEPSGAEPVGPEPSRPGSPVTHGVARRVAAVLVVVAVVLVVAVLVRIGAAGWWADVVTGYWDRLPLP